MATAVAAVLGIAVSAALAWEASQLAGQRVGLASEPLSVANYLSPATRSTRPHAAPHRGDDHPAAKHTVTVTSSASASASASAPVTTVAPTATAAPSTAATTVTPPAAAPTSTARAAGATLRAGHHGDGGDQHDD
jgi:hypothetical protein